MSHPSKVAFLSEARAAGYRTYLYYIATSSPRLNLQRVSNRGDLGGHSVAPDKVVRRYERSMALLPSAMRNCDRAFVFDNSSVSNRWLAELHPDGRLELKVEPEELPEWFLKNVSSSFVF